MSSIATTRLAEERKRWRKDHPPGFSAKPRTRQDGSTDLFNWECRVPGKEGTDWEGGLFPVTLKFGPDYPAEPPQCYLPPKFPHPNVYPSGQICLSLLSDYGDWNPSVSVKAIMLGIQELLDNPNVRSPAQPEATAMFSKDKAGYKRSVKAQVAKYPADAPGGGGDG